MLKIRYHSSFKKDYKKLVKRGYDIRLMEDTIQKLAKGEQLPEKNRDHSLGGDYIGCRECHIAPDWLLIYEIDNGELILYLTRTGYACGSAFVFENPIHLCPVLSLYTCDD